MHQCLQIREILASICSKVSCQTILTTTSHTTLLSLAATCCTFKETALDELWRIQTSLIPLVKCFPADSWEYRNNGRTVVCPSLKLCYRFWLSCVQGFTRPLSPSDWKAITPFATRINFLLLRTRTQNTSSGPNEFLPPEIWDMLAVSRPRSLEPLLPNLRELHWNQWRSSFRHLGQLLTPTLRRLEIHTPLEEIDDIGNSVLLSLQDICPSLWILHMVWSQSSKAEGQSLKVETLRVKAFQQWSSLPLRWLKITGYVDECILGHIGNISTLKVFQFGHDQTKNISVFPRQKFPALELLGVTGCNIDSLAQLLQSVASPSVRRVQALSCFCNSTTAYKGLFAALSQFPALELLNLVEISERAHPFSATPAGPRIIRSEDLAPLSKSSKLNFINIATTGIFELNDVLLAGIEWPDMQMLRLCSLPSGDSRWHRPSCANTLEGGLVPLLTRCPKLEYLEFYIDATIHDFSLEACPGNGVQNTTIKSLVVGASPISNTVKVAAFLFGILPNLSSIRATTHVNAWGRVVQHFGTFRAVVGWSKST